MKKEDFNLGDYNYEITVDDILVEINKDNMNEKTVAYANEILKLYISKKKEIIDYILNDCVLDFYESCFSKDEITKRLHEADIKIISDNWGTLTWLNHELDEHIISVEFNDDMQLSYVSIDG